MSHTLEVHFLGRSPHVLEIYRMVVAAAGEFGLVVEDSKKTSIHLNRRSAYSDATRIPDIDRKIRVGYRRSADHKTRTGIDQSPASRGENQ